MSLQQAVAVNVKSNQAIEIPAGKEHILELSVSSISIHSLTSSQMTFSKALLLGKLQFLVDIPSMEDSSDTLRTIVEMPVNVKFSFSPIIEVLPDVLNIRTVLEHFSKLEEMMKHYDDDSNKSRGKSPTATLSVPTTPQPDSPLSEYLEKYEGQQESSSISLMEDQISKDQLLKQQDHVSTRPSSITSSGKHTQNMSKVESMPSLTNLPMSPYLTKTISMPNLPNGQFTELPPSSASVAPTTPTSPIPTVTTLLSAMQSSSSVSRTGDGSLSALEETPRSLQQRELARQLQDSESKTSWVQCRLEHDHYELVIRNRWKERVTVSMSALPVIHPKYGVRYPRCDGCVFVSLVDIPEGVVLEPFATLHIQCALRPAPSESENRITSEGSRGDSSNSCIILRTSVFSENTITIPIAVHSSVSRTKLFDEHSSASLSTSKSSVKPTLATSSSGSTPLSLSLILKGVSAVVDGPMIVVDGEKVAVNEEKRVEIVLSGRKKQNLLTSCVGNMQ